MFYFFLNQTLNIAFAGSFIQDLYRIFIYRPQLNLLYFLHNLVGKDIGIAIVIIAVIVNLIILPLFAKSYINMQKTKVLQPLIKEIQLKHKENPQVMLKEMGKFNRKHGLNNSYTMLVLFVQLFFVSGLYFLIRDVVDDNIDADLYSFIFGEGVLPNFTSAEGGQVLAFGNIPINSPSGDYIYIPILVGLLSFAYGYYTFKLAPKPKLPKLKIKSKPKNNKEEDKIFDPEAMQKSMEFQTVYIMPLFLFAIQFSLPIGLSIYMAASSFLSLIRQIFLTSYYAGHTDKLVDKIAQSDPTSKDQDPSNNLENIARPEMIADEPVATKVIDVDAVSLDKDKTQKLSKKQKKKANKKKKNKN
jgi:YidC/Oxa1 family membrane protein insertase